MKFAFAIVSLALLGGAFAAHDPKFDFIFARGEKLINHANEMVAQAEGSGHPERLTIIPGITDNRDRLQKQMDNLDRMGTIDTSIRGNFSPDYLASLSVSEFVQVANRMDAEAAVYEAVFGGAEAGSKPTGQELLEGAPGLLEDAKNDPYPNRTVMKMVGKAERLMKEIEEEGFTTEKGKLLMRNLVYVQLHQ